MAKLFVSEAAGRCADRARAGVRRPRLPAQQRRRALPARAARRPDLGGDERGSAADHLPRAGAPRGRGDDPLTGEDGARRLSDLEPAAAAGVDRGRRRHRPPGQLRRPGAAQPRGDRLSRRGLGRQPEPRRGARAPVRAVDRRSPRAGRRGRGGDPGGGGPRRDRPGRGARVRRRRRVQRRLRRGRRRRGSCRRELVEASRAPRAAGVRPQLQWDRRDARAHCAVGRRARPRREPGAVALDLPERQRRRQRARPHAADCASTPWSRAATRRSCRPPTTSSSSPARTAWGRSRCTSRTTADRGCATGSPRAPRPASGWRCSRSGALPAGARAAAAHSAALAGDQRVFRSLVEEAGAVWAHDVHELLELAKTLARAACRARHRGRRRATRRGWRS